MKLIIDIPDELAIDIKDYCGMSMTDAKKTLPTILNAIHNGTPFEQISDEIKNLEINGYIRDVECFKAGINTTLNIIDKYR